MSDFNLTLFEACEYLNRSKKTISRYIRQGILHPQEIKSKQGTLEYRFSRDDIEACKAQETKGQAGQAEEQPKKARVKTPSKKPDKTRQDSDIIKLLKETTGLLKKQLVKKDQQIKDLSGKIDELIERDRESNILLGHLQSRVLQLEAPKEETITAGEQTRQDRQDNKNFWQKIFRQRL